MTTKHSIAKNRMDNTDRARLMGNDLTDAVSRLTEAISNLLAVLINRVTSLTASTLLGVIERQDRLEERVAALEELVNRHVGQVPGDGDR